MSPSDPYSMLEDQYEETYRRMAYALAENEQLKRLNANLREESKTLRRIPKGEVWFWQGDGEDYPESLGCPVIMEPDVLRAMLAKLERLQGIIREVANSIPATYDDDDPMVKRHARALRACMEESGE